MFDKRYYYLLEVQYLGFRYHGWQKQPNVITIQDRIERTLRYILGKEVSFKILAAGRTDAKVSVEQTFVEVFVDNYQFTDETLVLININLPNDIKALSLQATDKSFNIIQHPKQKTYQYFFSFGQKNHPYAAPFIYGIHEDLDIDLMIRAAKLFEGTHNFQSYCHRPNSNTVFTGTITTAQIKINTELQANFFPEISYIFEVKGQGFKRNQIRLMMGVLIDLGKGKVTLDFIEKTLDPTLDRIPLEHIAAGSGLHLKEVLLS